MKNPNIPEQLSKSSLTNEAEIEISFSEDEDESVVSMKLHETLQKQKEINVHRLQKEIIGPQIPTDLMKQTSADTSSTTNDQFIGPSTFTNWSNIKSGRAIHTSDKGEKDNIGPQIPKHLLEKKRADKIATSSDFIENDIGPQIPIDFLSRRNNVKTKISGEEVNTSYNLEIPDDVNNSPEKAEEEETSEAFAPALPPDLSKQRKNQEDSRAKSAGRRRRPAGPTFPVGSIPHNDNSIVGPLLPLDYNPEVEVKQSAIQAVEERARQAREAMEQRKNKHDKVERPEWMLVPPEVDYLKQASSNRSRQFTNKSVSKEDLDNSGWTDTPADKERKLQELKKRKVTGDQEPHCSAKDAEMRQNIQEYNMQTRPMSLMEMHQLKRKKEKRSDVEDVMKRPFDREKDLLGSRPMNKKQKKEFLQQSNELSKSFGYGRSSFL